MDGFFFSDRKPRGKWRQQRFGKRGASGEIGLADDPIRIKVEKNPTENLVFVSRFCQKRGPMWVSCRRVVVGEPQRCRERVPVPCGIAGESALRSLANPLLCWKEGRRRKMRKRRRGSSSVTAVKTSSPHPTTSQKIQRGGGGGGGRRFSATTERALSRVRAAEDRGS